MADLGYRLVRRHWGKGLASAGARALVRYGFDEVGIARVIAQTLSVNTRSRRVLERVGLTYVRTFPTSMPDVVDGAEAGEVEYELTREGWEQRQTRSADPSALSLGPPPSSGARRSSSPPQR